MGEQEPLRRQILLLHGAWVGAEAWRRVVPELSDRGHWVRAPTLAGLGYKPQGREEEIDLETHIRQVVDLLEQDDVHDVTLVGHSYGGMVVAGAADRAWQRISAVVFVDALVPRAGESVVSLRPERAEGEGWRYPPQALTVPPHRRDRWMQAMRMSPQPPRTLDTPLYLERPIEDRPFRRTYVHAVRRDHSAPYLRAARAAQVDSRWRYRPVHAGHDLIVTHVPAVIDAIIEAASPDERQEMGR